MLDKRALDSYICGEHLHDEGVYWHQCPHCKAVKSIPMFFELGGWFYSNEDDLFCEVCKTEGEGMLEMETDMGGISPEELKAMKTEELGQWLHKKALGLVHPHPDYPDYYIPKEELKA